MKTINIQLRYVLPVILFLGIQSFCCAQREEEQIKKVISAETEHYFARDMTKWKVSFVDNEKTAIIQKYANGERVSNIGFNEIVAKAKKAWEENPDMDFKIMSRLQWNISINGNVAWVTFKENQTINGTERPSEEMRVLVKENTIWKIALLSSIF